jgi:hypothetical protein
LGIDVVASLLFLVEGPATMADQYIFSQLGEVGGEVIFGDGIVVLVIVGNCKGSNHCSVIDIQNLAKAML